MRFSKRHLARSLRVVALGVSVTLGGCELLAELTDDEATAAAGTNSGVKAPLPPPPAPRLSRLASRRPAVERAGQAETAVIGDVEPIMAALPPHPVDVDAPVDTAPSAAVAPERVVIAPERVVGLTETALAAWLGDPSNRREESPARVWRYQGAGCVFDVFFYLDLVSRQFRALSYEIRNANSDDQRCLSPVFAGRGDPPRTAARRTD